MTTDPKALLKALKGMKPGTPLTPDGPCGGLYALMSSPGESTIITTGKEYTIVLIDHYDSLQNIAWDRYGWNIDTDGDRTTITVFVPQEDAPYTIKLSLHHSIDENMRFLHYLKSKRTLDMHLLSILHGELVKEGSYRFTVPETVASLIET